ncbi:MAG: hypothetical protein ACK55I_26365, partial [bacterium]
VLRSGIDQETERPLFLDLHRHRHPAPLVLADGQDIDGSGLLLAILSRKDRHGSCRGQQRQQQGGGKGGGFHDRSLQCPLLTP